ncbi:MAG: DNA replication and repair protein RecF [Rhodobacteraceae bacterium]|uniref:DNA replication/repair protein RecF n=1 Tax=Cypionkella sp. TaxID=2811411 RepID=UPI00132A0413|nr:DNA replication/repair protein RecF [Cypionkella sp.]KAF0176081.1 MAG: DNA replication and repair protein RecF [Paracoccaceae bacterium]MDO8328748.1 DNA replication/repair protein RecF [Cypionkella sp.]
MSGLAITALTLSHFRSHKAARLQFDGRPVAIVGSNGAGKTNILEAVSLLSPGRGLRRAGADEIARKPEGLGWKIAAEVRGFGADHQVETWAEGGESRVVRIDGKAATQAALGRILRVLWLVPSMDRLWIEAAEGRRRFLDRITLSFAPDHAEAVLAYEKAMRDRNRLLKDQVSDPHWYGALEGQMAAAGAQITANRRAALARLAAAQQGVETAFPRADLGLTAPEGEVEPLDLAQALADGRRRDMAAGRSLLGPHRSDMTAIFTAKAVPADQCSTGEQKALLISLILANARALAADLGLAPILLLDEVAAHLDAARRAALYDEICALGAQALMTGTEAALFDSLGPRAQTFTVADDNGASRILP